MWTFIQYQIFGMKWLFLERKIMKNGENFELWCYAHACSSNQRKSCFFRKSAEHRRNREDH